MRRYIKPIFAYISISKTKFNQNPSRIFWKPKGTMFFYASILINLCQENINFKLNRRTSKGHGKQFAAHPTEVGLTPW
jgi:hypothetical protein